jgi:cysteine sulfinate desulfinase/cysteine desulfurase-like protein
MAVNAALVAIGGARSPTCWARNRRSLTACATEANLALLGVAQAVVASGSGKRHLVVSAIEHPAVMAPALQLQAQGWDVTVVPVDGWGLVSADRVGSVLRDDTALVSIMHANNEVGSLQPIAEIAQHTRQRGIVLHTDAAQSAGKVQLSVDDWVSTADAGGAQVLRARACFTCVAAPPFFRCCS